MEKTEIERKYEIIVIVDAKLSPEEQDNILKTVADVVKKEGGRVINSQVWLEKNKFTFQIKKVNEGKYYIFNIMTKAASISKMRSIFRLNERILRFEFVKVESKKIANSCKKEK